uniref:Uncharacterized protein n=1 Tax=Trichogramma kaykai TaxID=54128 RepID=A0ABD2XFI0_9HYME
MTRKGVNVGHLKCTIPKKDDVMGDQCFDFMENEDDEDCDSSDDDECEAFKKLQEMLNNKDFHSPLNASVIASPCEMLFAITKFWSKYNLPNSGIQDMCKMINSFFDEDILPATRYRIDKLLSADEGIEYHGICPNCEIRIRTFDRKKEKSIYCNSCKKYVSVQDNNFLVTLDTSIDIRKLLESNEDYYHDLMYNRPKERNYLKDIFDGRMYKKFVSSLPKEDCKSFATCVFNSDGSPVFKSSSYSIWPIQISLNEIPPEIRQKKTITWALWFGKNKPNMNTFMGVFVNYINVYSKEGITCTIKSKQMKVKLFALCCCVDSIARSPMQGMTQFNGRYGCNWCLHPGVPIKNKKSNKTTLKFTLLDQEIVLRDSDSTIQHMKEALESGNRVMGVMRPAALINLQKFDIIRGFVPDGMHCLFLGVCRQFATYWFEAVNAPFYIPPKERCKLEKIIKSIKAPNQVSRLSRPLKDRKIWKSREWENWLLHYSLPILRSLNKFTVYADHWQLLVDSCHILLGESIKKTELRHIHEKLELFVSTTQKLYSKAAMTFNIHQLLHLVQSVADWGPLWAHHGYPFEDGNGQLVKTVKSAKGVLHQICRSINFKRCITLMEVHLKDKNSKTLNFCRNLDTKFTTKSFKVTSPSICRYFGKSHKVDDIWVSKLSLLEEFSESFVRMVKNECLFSSTVRKRTDDSFAQTKNGMFIKIEEFIIDSLEKKEYTLCKQINTIENPSVLFHAISLSSNITDRIETKSARTSKNIYRNAFNTMRCDSRVNMSCVGSYFY